MDNAKGKLLYALHVSSNQHYYVPKEIRQRRMHQNYSMQVILKALYIIRLILKFLEVKN